MKESLISSFQTILSVNSNCKGSELSESEKAVIFLRNYSCCLKLINQASENKKDFGSKIALSETRFKDIPDEISEKWDVISGTIEKEVYIRRKSGSVIIGKDWMETQDYNKLLTNDLVTKPQNPKFTLHMHRSWMVLSA